MKFKIFLLVSIFTLILVLSLYFLKPEENLCESINFPKAKEICYSFLSQNLTNCLNFKGLYKEICASAVLSRVEINEKFCLNLKDEEIRKICWRKLAKLTKNFEYCKDDICYFLVSEKEACERIKINYLKYTCLARVERKIEYCDYIKDDYERIGCKGLFFSDPKTCKVNHTYNHICLMHVAKNGDWKTCLKEPTPFLQAKCVALASKDIKNCEELSEGTEDLCKIFFLGRELNAA